MAHQLNERTDRFVRIAGRHGTLDRHVFVLHSPDGADKVRQNAERSAAEDGVTYVAIVTERVTWRGKNGKRTHTELSREVIKDTRA